MHLSHVVELVLSFVSIATADKGPPIYTPTPMLQPAYQQCEQFHLVLAGESCESIVQSYMDPIHLTMGEFRHLNPAIQGEPCTVVANNWYCVMSKKVTTKTGLSVIPPPPNEAHTGDKMRPTKTAEKEDMLSAKPKKPKITPGPPLEGHFCNIGSCWRSFAKLSTDKNTDLLWDVQDQCTMLFNEKCNDKDMGGVPDYIKEGCNDCKELSSGCICFTNWAYHTNIIYFKTDDHNGMTDWIHGG